MAVKIRLNRDRTESTFYRIVVADFRCKRDGRCIEEIGTYDPNLEPSAVTVNEEAAKKWLAAGAQPTDVVAKSSKMPESKNNSDLPDKAAYFCSVRRGRVREVCIERIGGIIAKSLLKIR